jgi:hypothetical protein
VTGSAAVSVIRAADTDVIIPLQNRESQTNNNTVRCVVGPEDNIVRIASGADGGFRSS